MTDATLTVGTHTLSVDRDTALRIIQACGKTGRRGGLVPISPDTVVWVTTATPLSITQAGRFADEYAQMQSTS